MRSSRRGTLKRIDVDPKNVQMGWIMDFCAQSLRNMVIGLGGKMDGYLMQSRFDIAVSSEVMAILAVVRDLKDLRERLGRITVAYDRSGKPVTCEDLEVAGAMTAFMRESVNPTLLQTVEGQPVFVHAGPFANIAVGQSSIIADRVALKLFDYNVTESGFAADIGFEKFWNVKVEDQRAQAERLRPHDDDPRPQDARRRAAGGAGAPSSRGIQEGEPGPAGEGRCQYGPPHKDHKTVGDEARRLHQLVPHGYQGRDRAAPQDCRRRKARAWPCRPTG